MKNLYLFLLLATNVIFISCMEQERQNQYHYENSVPVYVTNTNSVTTLHPYTSNNQYTFQPPIYCEANQPGWEFYDDIAHITYNSHQSQISNPLYTNEIPLAPIYKPAQSTIAQKEKKQLLTPIHKTTKSTLTKKDTEKLYKEMLPVLDKTFREFCLDNNKPLEPDKKIMQELYLQALNLIDNSIKTRHFSVQKETLITLIKHMNVAKKKNINEDVIGQFAFKNYTDSIGRHQRTVLLFPILKRYNITVQKTGEQLPLGLSQMSCHFDQYPAFFKILYSISSAHSDIPLESIEIFNDYIYGKPDILLKDYSNGSYKDFKNEFYNKAYDLVLGTYTDLNLFHLLQMIDKAKEVGDITNEDDLINHMTCFTKPQPVTGYLYKLFDSSYDDNNVRKKIIRLCELIKNYNNKRHYKINPTPHQLHVYCVQRSLDLPLSESLANKDLLDGNSYAFEEIKDLQKATCELRDMVF